MVVPPSGESSTLWSTALLPPVRPARPPPSRWSRWFPWFRGSEHGSRSCRWADSRYRRFGSQSVKGPRKRALVRCLRRRRTSPSARSSTVRQCPRYKDCSRQRCWLDRPTRGWPGYRSPRSRSCSSAPRSRQTQIWPGKVWPPPGASLRVNEFSHILIPFALLSKV